MAPARTKKVALVYPGDRAARDSMCAENNRFAQAARALAAFGLAAEPAVYHDSFADEVRRPYHRGSSHCEARWPWTSTIIRRRWRTGNGVRSTPPTQFRCGGRWDRPAQFRRRHFQKIVASWEFQEPRHFPPVLGHDSSGQSAGLGMLSATGCLTQQKNGTVIEQII
jgi:hypothetical protein